MDFDKNTAANKVLPQWGLTCFYETFVGKRTAVHLLNICAKNPPLRQYPNRYVPFYRNAPNNDKRTVKENKFAYYMFTYYICTDNFVKQNILKCGQQK